MSTELSRREVCLDTLHSLTRLKSILLILGSFLFGVSFTILATPKSIPTIELQPGPVFVLDAKQVDPRLSGGATRSDVRIFDSKSECVVEGTASLSSYGKLEVVQLPRKTKLCHALASNLKELRILSDDPRLKGLPTCCLQVVVSYGSTDL